MHRQAPEDTSKIIAKCKLVNAVNAEKRGLRKRDAALFALGEKSCVPFFVGILLSQDGSGGIPGLGFTGSARVVGNDVQSPKRAASPFSPP